MRSALAPLALAALAAANPLPAASASAAPAGCQTSYSGKFEIQTVNVTSSKAKRADEPLILTLASGILKDAHGRTGYIASNDQFQFDSPPQDNAIYTSGWSVCSNGTLALGDSAIFYQCLSGTFYNLYDKNDAAQCSPIYIYTVATGTGGEGTDGQPTAKPVTQISDGQIQATSAVGKPVCEYSDGQPQQTDCNVVTQISDGQIQATTGTAAVVTQISDGQIQATTGTGAVVTQISDGQIQATTGTGAVVTQISDGQIQATTGTAAVVTQISDGQIQATGGATTTANGTVATSTPTSSPVVNAAIGLRAELFGLAAGLLAIAFFKLEHPHVPFTDALETYVSSTLCVDLMLALKHIRGQAMVESIGRSAWNAFDLDEDELFLSLA
ncbi:protein containing internal repeats (PIR) [Acrodontium crateriforme]|uniref:Protein containing internal repeats (PIR) n=1 Tax=Acrodontium crateriforme TaxID=150365 RepID=A0AAQ3MDC1_9PEZI|nr:protein containing internal repeats (PIR) [Acrodontium crateriforme]